MMEEYHLFILWENARAKEREILSDIGQHFEIIKQYEIIWSPEYVASNFTRFYGTNLPANSEKEKHCGKGAFLLVVVKDNYPIYEPRITTRGKENVNINMFDSKCKYRSWTGGGHKIHATNTPVEFNHDITLLLGVNCNDFLNLFLLDNHKETKTIRQDIIGANGWKSIEKLFYVLNNTVRYVVLRGVSGIETANYIDHTDTDILTDDYTNFWLIANGKPCRSIIRPKERITINGVDYDLDLWNTDRKYYDKVWAEKMISSAIDNGFCKILTPINDFYCLLYHCLINKNHIADDYIEKLQAYKVQFNVDEKDWDVILTSFLSINNYDMPKPNDDACGFYVDQSKVIKEYATRYGILISRSDIVVDGNKITTKVYRKENSFFKVATKYLIDREYKYLTALRNEPFFPKVIDYGELDAEFNFIEVSKCEGVNPIEFFKIPEHQHLPYIKSFVEETLNVILVLIKHNILHRDVIPQNILVTEKNGKCSINIIDFGWAVDIGEKKTVTPKELGGRYHDKNGYSDAYSLGVIAIDIEKFHGTRYECRVGQVLRQITSLDYDNIQSLVDKIEMVQQQLTPTFRDRLSEWKFFIKKHYRKEFLFSLLPFSIAYKLRKIYQEMHR